MDVQSVGTSDPTLRRECEGREVVGPWLAVTLRARAAILAVSHRVEDGSEQVVLVDLVVNAVREILSNRN